jgi:hypothetical protein
MKSHSPLVVNTLQAYVKFLLDLPLLAFSILLIFAHSAKAFDDSPKSEKEISVGACTISANHLPSYDAATLVAYDGSSAFSQYLGGGAYFTGGVFSVKDQNVATLLKSDCNLTDIVNVVQGGAINAGYANEAEISHRFRATEASGDTYDYHFGVYGVTGTTAIATKTLYVDAAPRIASITRQIPSSALTNANVLTWRVVFDEGVQNVSALDFTITGAVAPVAVTAISPLIYDVTTQGGGVAAVTGTVTLGIASGQDIVDLSGGVALANTTPTGTNDNTFSVDHTPPTISIADFTGPLNGDQTAIITLSEDSTDFVLGDLSLGNATATLTGSGSSYTAVLTPLAGGEVSLSVAATTFTDAVGNDNTASNEVTSTADLTAPTISIAAFTGPANGDQSAEITLSEDSTDFVVGDLSLGNATATLTGAGSSYTAVLTPLTDGEVTLSVAANTFTDAAGNDNSASNEVSALFDGTGPGVELTTTSTSVSHGAQSTITATFAEPVTGFTTSDISVNNGTLTSLTGTGAIYTATIRATGSGGVEVSVAAGRAIDAANNGNAASNILVIADATVEDTQKTIAEFQLSRANMLLSNQPSLSGLLSGAGGGSFGLEATRGAGTYSFVSDPSAPIWMRLTGNWANEDTRETNYLFGVIGSHYRASPNLLIGGMVEVDRVVQDNGLAHVEGTGWLAGPYIVARVPEQELYIDGRLLYGQTSNEISPFGTYTDSFSTDRLLATLRVSGVLTYGETRLFPSLQASYATDEQHAYTDSLSNEIPDQKLELGQFELGMGFETPAPFYQGSGDLTLTGGLKGIISHTGGTGQAATVVPAYDSARARIDLGLNTSTLGNGGQLNIATFYDGIGASGFESYGLSLDFSLEF